MAHSVGVRSGLRVVARSAVFVLVLGLVVGSAACSSNKRAKVARSAELVTRTDIPAIMRGTIGAETSVVGTEPQLVSGLGIMVGLHGTGGDKTDLPQSVLATVERMLARGGVTRGGQGSEETGSLTPREFLRDPNVAVVLVEASISPGAPMGHRFDVYVRALPGVTSTTSLEHGLLWTTDLRLGPATTFGGYAARGIAQAKGRVFINPFATPTGGIGVASTSLATGDAVSRTRGRILGGGVVTNPLKLELRLDNASHARARSIVSAINNRFPQGRGDDGVTASGRTGDSIAIRVPTAYSDRVDDFIKLMQHTRIDQSFPEEAARRYVEELKRTPGLADELSWCLEALGKVAVPFLRPVYEYPEFAPRMAALRAGARLEDPAAVPHLSQLAQTGGPGVRSDAIALLGRMPTNPRVNLALRELAAAGDLDVRVAAYEALSRRYDPTIRRYAMGSQDGYPKFILETVPASDPLIYVTQQGQPRVVLFGNELLLNDGVDVSMWTGRLMLASDEPGWIKLRYRRPVDAYPIETRLSRDIVKFVRYLAHTPRPEEPDPGLDMTYSEVVGALYEIQKQGAMSMAFATEQDKLWAELLQASNATTVADRPESDQDVVDEPGMVYKPTDLESAPTAEEAAKRTWVVPLNPAPPPKR